MRLEYERISGLDKQVPSLVDLCIRTAIDNVRYLGDVGETDLHLLEHILPHCTIDQLMHVEKSSKVSSAIYCCGLGAVWLWLKKKKKLTGNLMRLGATLGLKVHHTI